MGRIYKGVTLENGDRTLEVVAFVDTGCDQTIISGRAARFLNITMEDEEIIVVANGAQIKTLTGMVVVRSSVDRIHSRIKVNITDLPFQIDPDENIDMVVGLDFLQMHNITLKLNSKVEKVRAAHVVLACYNSVIPHMCPEMPAAQREALIKEITTKVRASTDLDKILQTTVKEIGDAIGGKRTYVHLVSPSNGEPKTSE